MQKNTYFPPPSFFVNAGICDPTPYEVTEEHESEETEKPFAIFDGLECPICHKQMMSDEWITSITHPQDTFDTLQKYVHSQCIEECTEKLECLGFTLLEDTGKWWEK